MRTPGFTAQSSDYRSSGGYARGAGSAGWGANALHPQQLLVAPPTAIGCLGRCFQGCRPLLQLGYYQFSACMNICVEYACGKPWGPGGTEAVPMPGD